MSAKLRLWRRDALEREPWSRPNLEWPGQVSIRGLLSTRGELPYHWTSYPKTMFQRSGDTRGWHGDISLCWRICVPAPPKQDKTNTNKQTKQNKTTNNNLPLKSFILIFFIPEVHYSKVFCSQKFLFWKVFVLRVIIPSFPKVIIQKFGILKHDLSE